MERSTITYKCPGCGGELIWNGELERFICEWCSSVYYEADIIADPSELTEESKHRMELESKFADDTDVYICSSCGAEIICDHNTAASICYICHNPVALGSRLSGNFRPEMIIPFQLSKREAQAAFRAQCMKKHFLPSDFLKSSTLDDLTGLYVPFWLCDCTVDTYMHAGGNEVTYRNYNHETISIKTTYDFKRGAKMTYMGIPADSARKIDDAMIDAIEPYDYRFFREFDMSFLSGYYCDKYDVSRHDVLSRIEERVMREAPDVLLRDLNRYEDLLVSEKRTRIINTDWHYVMLPVWFLSYKHKGKLYSFAMNGQTGKFSGKFPISEIKLLAASLLIAIAAALITGLCLTMSLKSHGITDISPIPSVLCGVLSGTAFYWGAGRSYTTHEPPTTNNYLDVRTIDMHTKNDTALRTTKYDLTHQKLMEEINNINRR